MSTSSTELAPPVSRGWRRRLRRAALMTFVGAAALIAAVTAWIYLVPFPQGALAPDETTSLALVDRHGAPLREVLSGRAGRARWMRYDELEPRLMQAAIAVEDARFEEHLGVDPLAIARASIDNARTGRVVSGASTITMQVVRLIWPRPRTLSTKLSEAVWAMRLERALSKREIMEQYLNRAPFGNQLFGVEAAAQAYLGKSARRLSPAEAAFLMGLPQSPTGYNPWRALERAKRRQRWVIDRMEIEGVLSPGEARQARSEQLALQPRARAFRAPHLVDHALKALPKGALEHAARIELTLDLELQAAVESIVRGHVDALADRDVTNAAVVVLDNHSGEVLAMVGSYDYFDAQRDGQVNGATALRQPGSTLKPFTYALAFERGWTPATLIADIPTHYQTTRGSYSPQNFDRRFRGPVRARDALAGSLNIPAVRALDAIGVDTLLGWLREAEVGPLEETPDHYGLALTLGAGETRLLDLSAAYMMLARGGEWIAPQVVRRVIATDGEALPWPPPSRSKRLLREVVAAQVTNILSDPHARASVFGLHGPLSFPFDVAAKTGTSSDFRDIWTFGYTTRYTVGVWVGNFDSSPMRKVSGSTGAAPIFRDVILALHGDAPPARFANGGLEEIEICALSGARRGEECPHGMRERFEPGSAPEHTCEVHRAAWIDPANGLLADEACAVEGLERRTLTVLPEAYDAWLRSTGSALPPRMRSPRCGGDRDVKGEVTIIHPVAGSTYLYDAQIPASQQQLELSAAAPAGVDAVLWLVNGEEVARSEARPFRAMLSLAPGAFRIEAVGLSGGERVGVTRIQIEVE